MNSSSSETPRGRAGLRPAVPFDERRTQLAKKAVARCEAPLTGLDRPKRLRAEEQSAPDRRPTAQRVLHRRLTEDEVRVTGRRIDDVARRLRLLREPREQLAYGALVLEPHVGLARLRGVPAARAALLDT